MTYKKDTLIGTWIITTFILLSGFGTILYFNHITAEYTPPTPECDVCRWTDP